MPSWTKQFDEDDYNEFKNRLKKRYDEEIHKFPKKEPVPHDPYAPSTTVPRNFGVTPTPPSTPFEDTVRKIALEAADILIKKHQDYGPDNINNAPGGAINGLLVRMHDKMERLKTLILGKKTPRYESIEDTLLDLINYSIIALMVQRGKWPK